MQKWQQYNTLCLCLCLCISVFSESSVNLSSCMKTIHQDEVRINLHVSPSVSSKCNLEVEHIGLLCLSSTLTFVHFLSQEHKIGCPVFVLSISNFLLISGCFCSLKSVQIFQKHGGYVTFSKWSLLEIQFI